MSEPDREDYLRRVENHVAMAWNAVEQIKLSYQEAGFDSAARLKAEVVAAQFIDECEWILEFAQRANEENSLRELPKIIAAVRALDSEHS